MSEILTGDCEGGRCWWNGETGYLEACEKHESQGMEAMMALDERRKREISASKTPKPQPVAGEA